MNTLADADQLLYFNFFYTSLLECCVEISEKNFTKHSNKHLKTSKVAERISEIIYKVLEKSSFSFSVWWANS